MTLSYNISQEKQIWKQTYYPEERKWIQKRIIKTYKCSKKSYRYDEQQFKMEYLLYYLDKNIYK